MPLLSADFGNKREWERSIRTAAEAIGKGHLLLRNLNMCVNTPTARGIDNDDGDVHKHLLDMAFSVPQATAFPLRARQGAHPLPQLSTRLSKF